MATMAVAAITGTTKKDNMTKMRKQKMRDSTQEHVNDSECRQMGASSRCPDMDERINAMLRRKVQLPSLSGGQGLSGKNGSHIAQLKSLFHSVDIESSRLGQKPRNGSQVYSDVYSLTQGRKAKISSPPTVDDMDNCLISEKQSRYEFSPVMQNIPTVCVDSTPSRASMNPTLPSSKTRGDVYSVPQVSQLLTTGANSSAQVHRGANSVRGIARAVSAPFKGSRIPGLAYAVAPDSAFPTFVVRTPEQTEDTARAESSSRAFMLNATGNDMDSPRFPTTTSTGFTSDDLDMKVRIDNLMMRTTDTSRLMHEAREMATAETQAEPKLMLPTKPTEKNIESLGKSCNPSDSRDEYQSTNGQFSGKPEDRLSDSGYFGGGCYPRQFVDHSYDDHILPQEISRNVSGHGGAQSTFDFLRHVTASESIAGSLVVTPLRATPRVTGTINNSSKNHNQLSRDGPSDRYIKNEHTFSPLPSLDQILDYVDEMASPILPGMDIKSSQRGRQHLSLDDPLRADTDEECSNRDAILGLMEDTRACLSRQQPKCDHHSRIKF
jgi:hypothetical protein